MRKLFLVVFLLIAAVATKAQTDTAFWFAVPEASSGHGDNPIYLRLTSQSSPSTVKVYVPSNSSITPITVSLAANSVSSIDLSSWKESLENKPANTVLNYGLKIEASTAITAYYEEASTNNPEIFALKGKAALGTLFYVPGQTTYANESSYTPTPYNSFDIVATEDNTVVTIVPKQAVVGHAAGVAYTVTLNKGQTYSAWAVTTAATGHLGGSKISSTKPVAVTFKDDSVINGSCRDMGGDQIVPVEMLGQEYIAINGYLTTGTDIASIMAVQDGTTITIDGVTVTTLNTGETYQKTFSSNPIIIKSDKPVSVLHITGRGCELGYAMLPQIGCNGSYSIGITRPGTSPFSLFVLCEEGSQGGFSVNGNTTVIKASDFKNLTGSWRYARVDLTTAQLAGGASALITNAGKFHLGIVYGNVTDGVSYGYFSNFASASSTLTYNSPVCTGGTINFTCDPGTTSTGLIYEWTGPNGFTSSLQNPSISNASAANAGTYYCKVTNQGCFVTLLSVQVTVNAYPVASIGSLSPVCAGNALNITGTSDISGVTYAWSGPNGFSSSLQNVSIANATTANGGTYTLTLNNNGCTSSKSVSATVNALPDASITGTTAICENSTLSLASVNAASTTYSWSGPNGFSSNNASISVASFSAIKAGSYSLTATANSCSTNSSVSVSMKSLPTAQISGTNSLCAGNNINLSATDAGVGSTYTWSGPNAFSSGSSSFTINSGASANSGTYNLTVSLNGCSATASQAVIVKPLPVASISGANSVCENAAINLNAADAGVGATYAWSGPNAYSNSTSSVSIANASSSNNGAYNLNVTLNGCSSAASQTVTVKPLPVASVTGVNSVCENAAISLNATDAGVGATYAWSGPNAYSNNSASVNILNAVSSNAGVYNLTVTLNSCSSTASKTVAVKPLPVAAITGSNSICENGAINLIASDAGVGATYTWSGPNSYSNTTSSVNIINALSANGGAYNLNVTLNGCSATVSKTVSIKPLPIASITGSAAVCENGSISLTASDAGAGATYAWSGPGAYSNSASSINITNAASSNAGTYNLNVTLNGCSTAASQTVAVKPLPIASITGTNSVCENAGINLSAADAGVGATYTWSGPNAYNNATSSVSITNASSSNNGIYNLSVALNGCSATASQTVTVKPLPIASISGANGVCENAAISLTAADAGVGATYAWSGPNAYSNTTSSISIFNASSSNAGAYNLNVILDGCSSGASQTITVKPLPVASVTGVNSVCENAAISLNATDAGVGATYAWSGPNAYSSAISSVNIVNASSSNGGAYNLIVTLNGCSATTSQTVSVKPLPVASITGANSVCENAGINLTAADAGVGATYTWSGPNSYSNTTSSVNIINAISANGGAYNLNVTLNGCSATVSKTVSVKPLPIASITGSAAVCENASISLTASDAGAGAIYAWSGPGAYSNAASSINITNAASANAGTYNLNVTLNGCSTAASQTVAVKPLPIASITGTNSVCENAGINLSAADAGTGAVYTWSGPNAYNNATSSVNITTASSSNGGVYNLNVALNGCSATASQTVTVKPLPIASISGINSVCENAAISLSAADAGVGATYAWSGPNAYSNATSSVVILNASSSNAGGYNLNVTLNGCSATTSQTVSVKPLPIASISGVNSVCENAGINLTAADAGIGATYAWSGPNAYNNTTSSVNISNASSSNGGAYGLIVGLNGCSSTTSQTVTVKPLPVASINGISSVCENASISLSATDAGVGATYTWSGPNAYNNTTSSISISNASSSNGGAYSLIVGLNGCSSATSQSVTVKPVPVASISGNNSVCENAAISLNAADAGVGATYTWSGPNAYSNATSSVSISNAVPSNAGAYNLNVMLNGCSATTSQTVSVKSLPVASITGLSSVCENSAISLSAADAGVGATYAWSGPNAYNNTTSSVSISNASSSNGGAYSLIVGLNGCSATSSQTVSVKPLPIASITGSNSVCENGTIGLNAANAGAGATYAWSGPNAYSNATSSVSLTNAVSANGGTYNLNVALNGCSSTASQTVTVKPLPIASIAGVNSVCENATISLSAADAGVGALYAWSGPNSYSNSTTSVGIASAASSNDGTYNLSVTLNGCSATASQTVTVKPLPIASISGANSVCENAAISLTAADAGVGATYAWSGPNAYSNNSSSVAITNAASLNGGVYNLNVTLNGCSSNASQTVTVKPLPVASITGVNSVCENSSINLSAADAGAGATYTWSGPNAYSNTTSSVSISNAGPSNAGAYNLNVTLNGCSSIASQTVVVKPLPIASITGVSSVCESDALSLTAADAGAGAQYAWSGPNSYTNATSLVSISNASSSNGGAYNLIVTLNGCSATSSQTVSVKPLPIASITGSNSVCENGTIGLNAANAGAGASYAWSGPNAYSNATASVSITNAATGNAGTYNLNVILNGCSSTTSQTVTVKPLPIASITGTNSVCEKSAISLSAADAGIGATYVWSGPNAYSNNNSSVTITNAASLNGGVYNLNVTLNGCSSNALQTVTVKPLPVASIIGANSVCENAAISLTAADGGMGATYTWSGPNAYSNATSSVDILNASSSNDGAYNLIVTLNGCSATASQTVSVKPLPIASISGVNSVCENGSISLSAADAGGGATYTWSGPNAYSNNSSSVAITNAASLNGGVYNLNVTLNGCSSNALQTVTVKPLPVASISGANSVCENAAINLNAADAGVSATYAWSGPNTYNSAISSVNILNASSSNNGAYNLIVTLNGCSATASQTVSVKPLPIASISGVNSVCENGSISLSAADAGVSATYTWSGPNAYSNNNSSVAITNAASLNGGVYNLNVTLNGCSSNASQTVTVKPLPVASISGINSVCENAAISLNAADAGVGATYAWSGPNAYNNATSSVDILNASSSNAGAYNLNVTLNGCSATTSQTVSVKPLPIASISGVNGVCENAGINLTAADAGIGATYAWSGPNAYSNATSSVSISNASSSNAGVYNLNVVLNGCTSTTSQTVTVKPLPVASISGVNSVCENASISLTAAYAGGGASYTWSGPNAYSNTTSSVSISNAVLSNAGAYNLNVTLNGCSSSTSQTVAVKPLPIASITGANSVCENATINLTAADAGVSATYAWSGPNAYNTAISSVNILNASSSNAGAYNLIVTLNGCSATASQTVSVKPLPVASITGLNSVCENAMISLNAADAGVGATYTWSGPNAYSNATSSVNISNASSSNGGAYALSVGLNGCSATTSQTVTVKPLPVASISGVNSVCENAAINLSAADAGVGATYTWSGPNAYSNATSSITIASAASFNGGVYNLNVTMNGCSSTASQTVTVKPLPVASITGSNSVCESAPINLSAADAGVGATYTWSGPYSYTSDQTTINIGSAALTNSGTYNLTVTLNGCSSSAAGTVTVKPLVKAVINGLTSICEKSNIELSVSDQGPGVTYNWNGPAGVFGSGLSLSVNKVDEANAGTYYMVTTRDGCQSVSTIDIDVKELPKVNFSGKNELCEGENLSLSAADAGTGAQYVWEDEKGNTYNGAQFIKTAYTLDDSKNIFLTVTKSGCVNKLKIPVNAKALPVAAIAGSQSLCEGDAMNLSAADAGLNAAYTWTTPDNNSNNGKNLNVNKVNNAQAGDYVLTVQKDGCSNKAVVNLKVKSRPIVKFTGETNVCENNAVMFSVKDAPANASFYWEGPSAFTATTASVQFEKVSIGNRGSYAVTVTKDGCSVTDSVMLKVKSLPTAEISADAAVCENASVQLNAADAGAGAQYIWAGPMNFTAAGKSISVKNVSQANAGDYQLTVLANGCVKSVFQTISVKALPVAAISGTTSICENEMIKLSAQNAGTGADYIWKFASKTFTGDQLSVVKSSPADAGEYALAVTQNGCTSFAKVNVTVKSNPIAQITGATSVCANDKLTLKAENNTGSVEYKWFKENNLIASASGFTINQIQAADAGTYSLVAERNGCAVETKTMINVKALPQIDLSGNKSVCERDAIQLKVKEEASTNYVWKTGNQSVSVTSSFIISKATTENAGDYTIQAMRDGCSAAQNFAIEVRSVKASIKAKSVVCENDAFSLSAADAGTNAVYKWTGPSFTGNQQAEVINSIQSAQSGMFVLTVQNNGCFNYDSLLLHVKPAPFVTVSGKKEICENDATELSASKIENASYAWQQPDGKIVASQNLQLVNAALQQSGVYKLTVTNDGCSYVTSAAVKVKALPNAKIVGEETICEGLSLQYLAENAGDNAVYSWTLPGNTEVSGTGFKIAPIQLTNSGLYKLNVSLDGCSASTEKYLKVTARPDALVYGNTSICETDKLQLTAGDAGEGSSYKWILPNGSAVNNKVLQVTNIQLLQSGGYTLSVSRNGCTVNETANVIVKKLPSASIQVSENLCEGQTLILKAVSNDKVNDFEWSGPKTISTVGEVLTVNNIQSFHTGNYQLRARMNGCESITTQYVKVKALPRPIIHGVNAVCEGGTIELNGADAQTVGNFTWFTPDNQVIFQQAISLGSVTEKNAGQYKLKVEHEGCVSYDSLQVTVNKNPLIAISAVPDMCQYTPNAIVKATELTGMKGVGVFSGQIVSVTGELLTSRAGSYVINYAFTTKEGCSASANTTVKINPGISVNAGNDVVQYEEEGVQLNAMVSGNYAQLTWSPSAGTSSNVNNPFVRPSSTTAYTVTVVNEFGCTAKDEVTVKVVRMKIPNAFSPNNDGINDKWEVEALKSYPNCKVDVFNRAGQLVYTAKGAGFSWDGKLNGSPAPEGTYYYVINVNDGKERKPLSGWLQILR